jgi:hypothetical protein
MSSDRRGRSGISGSIPEVVVAALALSVLALPLRAQKPAEASQESGTIVVLPGDARLDASRLVPHRATWRVTIHDADGSITVQGLWTDTWVRSEEDGRPVMAFRTLFVDTLGKVLVDNETVFDATSFRALRSTQRLPPSGTRLSYRFDGDTVSGTLRQSASAESRQFEMAFDEPVWEPLTPVPWLFPFERLEPGTVIRYPIWDQTGPGDDVAWRTFRVGSIRSVRAPDGSPAEALSHTMTTDTAPGVVFRVLRMLEPPYLGWWLRVERPGLTREWALVDWELYAPDPSDQGSVTSPVSERRKRAQTPEAPSTCAAAEIAWERAQGSRGPDWITSIDLFPDGAVAASGLTNPAPNTQWAWVSLLDAAGNPIWERTYGGDGIEWAEFLQALPEGGLVVVGATSSRGEGDFDGWVFRLDPRGEIVWDRTFGGARKDRIDAVRALPDGGFIVSGDTESGGDGPFDGWVIRLDADGNAVWERTYGGTGRDEARFVDVLSDGGFAVAGLTTSRGAGDEDAWILRLDATGEVVWEATVGGAAADRALELRETADGGIIAVGITHSRGDPEDADALALKLDREGRVVWERALGEEGEDSLWGLWPLADGSFVAAGSTPQDDGEELDAWLVTLDAAGEILVEATCGGEGGNRAGTVRALLDGGLIVAGQTQTPGAEFPDIWLVRLALTRAP